MATPVVTPFVEVVRQCSVAEYGLTGLDAWKAPDTELMGLTVAAQKALGVKTCAICILDEDRQWSILGWPGVPVELSVRRLGLCHRILARPGPAADLFVTADASQEAFLADSPWVNGASASIKFYAAAPLIGREGLPLGAVCMWSEQPHSATDHVHGQLAEIRDAVMEVLEARRRSRATIVLAQEARPTPAPDRLSVTQQVPPYRWPARVYSSSQPVGVDTREPDNWTIDTVIDDRAVRTLFQPVVHLATGTIAGFEALSRGPMGSSLESPMQLLEAAKTAGRLGELDWECRVHAMQVAVDAGLPMSLSWLINVEPAGLAMPCPEHLLPSLTRARSDLAVILEVVERDLEGCATDLLHATDQARRDSWGVALDDVGAEEGSLALLPFLRPDVVKLDMSLVRGAPRAAAAGITAAVRAYSERTGAVILAEGIETEEQEHLARVFGATYAQGYRYGSPGPLPEYVPPPTRPIPLRQRLAALDGRSPFAVLNAETTPQRAPKHSLLHISEHLEERAGQDRRGCVLLTSFQDRRFFSARKRQRYEDLARYTALTVVLAEDLDTWEQPRFHIGAPRPGSVLPQEWVVIVVEPHYAAAFVARDCGDTGPDSQRRFDYFYTHNRDLVIAAARSFMQELDGTESALRRLTAAAALPPSTLSPLSTVTRPYPATRSRRTATPPPLSRKASHDDHAADR